MTQPIPICGAALPLSIFKMLLQYIANHHRFGINGKMIKYVLPTIDMRTMEIFHVHFRGMFDPVEDGKEFDYRDNGKPMYENIMKWLDEKEPQHEVRT